MKLQAVPLADVLFPLIGSLCVAIIACGAGNARAPGRAGGAPEAAPPSNGEDRFFPARQQMVERQIRARGIRDERVLAAMLKVPRHLFVPAPLVGSAYEDGPLPIGLGQTISQPYIVALMTELLAPARDHRVFEVGTGSGYQAAVLAELVREVYTIEIVEPLAREATERLAGLGYRNVHVRAGDGYRGWPEKAPFDSVIITAAPDHVPQPLIDQLKVGGRMVLPLGDRVQDLVLITKTETGIVRENITGVRFVPMTGEAEEGPKPR